MEEQSRNKEKKKKTLTRHSFNLYSVLLLILNTFCYTTRVLQEKNKTMSIVSNTKATSLIILVFNNTILCKNSIDIFTYSIVKHTVIIQTLNTTSIEVRC